MRKLLPLLVIAVLSAFAPPEAAALQRQDQDRARDEVLEGKMLGYGEIVRIATRAVPGRIVGQELRRTGRERYVYRLKIMQEGGQVAILVVDAHTGQILSVKGKR